MPFARDDTAPDLSRSALITVDVQNDFTLPDAPARIAGTDEILPTLHRLAEGYRRGGLPIIHLIRLYEADGSNADLCRRAWLVAGNALVRPGSEGAELVEALKPTPEVRLNPPVLLSGQWQPLGKREWVLYKPRWGGFYGTPLEAHLRQLEVHSLVVVGCNYPNCPRTTIYEASERDFRLVLVTDAMSGLYERGEREMVGIGVRLRTAEALLAELDGRK